MSPLEILEEAFGPTEWTDQSLTSLFRVIELTREDERIKQMANMEDQHKMLVESILHLLYDQQAATGDRHNYWMTAANLIKAEFGEKE